MVVSLIVIMGLFGRKKEQVILGNTCPKCNMEFTGPERMMRHMLKAHKKKNSTVTHADSQLFTQKRHLMNTTYLILNLKLAVI